MAGNPENRTVELSSKLRGIWTKLDSVFTHSRMFRSYKRSYYGIRQLYLPFFCEQGYSSLGSSRGLVITGAGRTTGVNGRWGRPSIKIFRVSSQIAVREGLELVPNSSRLSYFNSFISVMYSANKTSCWCRREYLIKSFPTPLRFLLLPIIDPVQHW